MGSGFFSKDVYNNITTSYSDKKTDEIFKNRNIHKDMSPLNVYRECCDSYDHPDSLPIIIMFDVTGSMGSIPDNVIRSQMPKIFDVLSRGNIKDAEILFGGIGDHLTDNCPIQIGQFEANTELLIHWLENIYIEKGGGGQNKESYLLSYIFASNHTKLDSIIKRNKKGFLFTIGDEATWDNVKNKDLIKIFGNAYNNIEVINVNNILEDCKRKFNVYHIHINETAYRNNNFIIDSWNKLLGNNLLILENQEDICELIGSIIYTSNNQSNISFIESNNVKSLISSRMLPQITNYEHK